MNSVNVKIANNLLKLAKELLAIAPVELNKSSNSEQEKEFQAFKNHIIDACNTESQKIQELYSWCQTNYNAYTTKVDVFDDIYEIKSKIDALSEKVKKIQ